MDELLPTSDEDLLTRTARRDEAAFEELVRRYKGKIINLAYRFVHDADVAEDIAADVFFRIWQNAAGFKGTAKFSTWCYRIAVNACLNYRTAAKSTPLFEYLDRIFTTEEGEYKKEIAEPPQFQPDVALQTSERETIVHAALDTLAPQQKMAFMLSWFEGYSYKEIADIMELSVPAVESLLFRAKENLKKRIIP